MALMPFPRCLSDTKLQIWLDWTLEERVKISNYSNTHLVFISSQNGEHLVYGRTTVVAISIISTESRHGHSAVCSGSSEARLNDHLVRLKNKKVAPCFTIKN
jgi:hypothetical protein